MQILAWLPKRGVGYEDRIEAIGYGEIWPIFENDDTEEKRAKNRRTFVKITYNGTGKN